MPRTQNGSAASPSDEQLIDRIREGDRAALHRLHERYRSRIASFVRRFKLDQDDAEEVVNDVFMAAWTSAKRFEGRSQVSSWLFGIAYRQAMKRLRGKRPMEPDDGLDSESRLAAVTSDDLGPSESLESEELAKRALSVLPLEQRMMVELTFIAGLSYPEIAEATGCPLNTVKTRMFHARKRMRAVLGPAGDGSSAHATTKDNTRSELEHEQRANKRRSTPSLVYQRDA